MIKKLKMILFHNVIIFVTAYLLHNEVLATQNPDRASTTSAPFAVDEQKSSPKFIDFFSNDKKEDEPSSSSSLFEIHKLKKRIKCKKEINAVFNENSSPEEHVRYAIRRLTVGDSKSLGLLSRNTAVSKGYAHMYYLSYFTFLRKGDIPSVEDYCKNATVESVKCCNAIKSVFLNNTPKKCLVMAFRNLNEKIVMENGNRFVIEYFFEVYRKFSLNINPLDNNNQRYLRPNEYCDSLISIPPEERDLKLTL